ncbi:MAG: helix-turn-helix domain-containing protein [Patescibacteria group bacterium]
MKTIGSLIKEARTRKKISLTKLEGVTKIKKEFLQALEAEAWNKLPEYPVVSGFVKNIAHALGVSERNLLAVLRRDYPPQSLPINPKPDVEDRFVWSPKLTFMVGVGIVVVFLLAYLTLQYKKFVSPPSLSVFEPKEGQTVSQRTLKVSGKTDSDATVKINNQPVILDADGNFSAEILVYEGTTEIEIRAKSRAGKQTVVRRKIVPELKE